MTEELKRVCGLVSRLSEKARADLKNRSHQPSLPKGVMLYWFAKGAKTYDATRLLFEEGYWQDAGALSRTILEIVFQSKFLSEDPEAHAELFMIMTPDRGLNF